MVKIDPTVLKRTTALLSEIDLALNQRRTADAVERVLQTAARGRGSSEVVHAEAWARGEDWWKDDNGAERSNYDHRHEPCDCGVIHMIFPDISADPQPVLECQAIFRENVFYFDISPYQRDNWHAAPEPCGAEDCACIEIFKGTNVKENNNECGPDDPNPDGDGHLSFLLGAEVPELHPEWIARPSGGTDPAAEVPD